MFIFSFEKRKGYKLAAIFVSALFLVSLCLFIAFERHDAVKGYATADEVGRYVTEAPDTEGRLGFLSQFGIEAEPDSEVCDSVVIPKAVDDTYNDYNSLQKGIGLELEPFRGESVSRFTYRIKDSRYRVTLLCFKAHVIAGHISSGVYGERYLRLNSRYGKTG